MNSWVIIILALPIISALHFFTSSQIVFGDDPVSTASDPDPVTITKSVSTDELPMNGSAIIVLTIKNLQASTVNDFAITDIIPPMFSAEPKELIKNNIFQAQIGLLGNASSFTYSISPVKDLKLSKDWTLLLPAAQATYKVNNSIQVHSAISKSPPITLISDHTDWWTIHWPLYLIVLISIASAFGAIGGLINYIIKYRSSNKAITSNSELEFEGYGFDLEYSNYIGLGDSWSIKVSSYRKIDLPAGGTDPEIRCCLFVGGKEEYSFKIEIGNNQNNKKDTSGSYIINAKNAYLVIKVGDKNSDQIDIIFIQESLTKDVIAGFAAGLVTLLTLQIAATVIASQAYPANVQSLITLVVSALIAGLVPFQILEKATSQLQETIKVVRAQNEQGILKIKEADAQKKIIVDIAYDNTTEFKQFVDTVLNAAPDTVINTHQLLEFASERAKNLKKILEGFR